MERQLVQDAWRRSCNHRCRGASRRSRSRSSVPNGMRNSCTNATAGRSRVRLEGRVECLHILLHEIVPDGRIDDRLLHVSIDVTGEVISVIQIQLDWSASESARESPDSLYLHDCTPCGNVNRRVWMECRDGLLHRQWLSSVAEPDRVTECTSVQYLPERMARADRRSQAESVSYAESDLRRRLTRTGEGRNQTPRDQPPKQKEGPWFSLLIPLEQPVFGFAYQSSLPLVALFANEFARFGLITDPSPPSSNNTTRARAWYAKMAVPSDLTLPSTMRDRSSLINFD